MQALRALAALAVVVFHAGRYVAGGLPEGAWRWGEFGVDVFFVISGVVMMVAVPREAGWREFARRRAVRILPMYWLATAAMALAMLVAPGLFSAAVLTWPHFVLSVLLVPHYSPALPGEIAPLLVPGWTLSYELYFYLVFALFLRAGDGRRVIGVAGVLALAFAIGRFGGDAAWAVFLGKPLVFEFVFGLAVGYAWRRGWRLPLPLAVGLALVAVAGLVVMSTPANRVYTAGVAGLVLAWAAASLTRVPRGLATLGDASYSLYLLHPFVVGAAWVAWQRVGGGNAYGFIALCLGASAFAGWLAWRLIEAPMLRRLRRAAPRGA